MSFQEAFFSAPPVTRTITAAAVLISVPGHLELYNLAWVVFFKDYVFTLQQLPQLWRTFTCFFITGPSLGLIMDPFFLYHYSSQLETGAARFSAPGAYAFYLLFVAMVILLLRFLELSKITPCAVQRSSFAKQIERLWSVGMVGFRIEKAGDLDPVVLTGGIYLGGAVLLSALNMALIYTFAQEDPNRQVQFFIVQMPAKYLPYASLAITYLVAGPFQTMIQSTGILAAHMYDFLDRVWPTYGGGQKYTTPPLFIQKLFTGTGQPQTNRAYGTAFASRSANQPAAQNQGSGPLPNSWTSGSAWSGSGRRLGGD
ncbi:DER1-domain-containing protein [Sphaerulina musiva SO2202]|uniref:Derlin n=1 Tax=Sphaerulina musiva (strain SO2202) TaxID=692275 RepID=N1QFN1_SPHMS|nr:DER1-domain-containing protein [Sphaerulina musiva SO2202]EMF12042.1 DER1-domain-containing protein [Sphaerulina musiva SO2202]